jgi:methionyl-tRNA formyltransferase
VKNKSYMNKTKIGYFADGKWSHETLTKLVTDDSIDVIFICLRKDGPDLVLEKMAEDYKIQIFKNQDINSDEFFKKIEGFDCDLFISMSFNQIFKEKLLGKPRLKTINCHAGKLPFYRGRNVINWALINDEKEFGITVHYIDTGIDSGDIILQRTFPINDADDYSTLLSTAYTNCPSILYDATKLIQTNNVKAIKQVEIDPLGFYCTSRKIGDELIHWEQDSRALFNFIRAICSPGPGARTFLNGNEIIIQKVKFLSLAKSFVGIPGTVIGIESDGFLVKTLDSFIKVLTWSGYDMPRIGDRFS